MIPVPSTLDPAEAVTLVLNYIVAYQSLHRSARVQRGDKVLIVGASGGIGTALLQLGKLAGLKLYGLASPSKHAILAEYGAVPIDYHTQDFVELIHQAEPGGLDAVVSGVLSVDYIRRGLAVLRPGGTLVAFGEPAGGLPELFRILRTTLSTNLLPFGTHAKTVRLYGTSFYFLGARKPFLEDWAALFELLEAGQIKPVIEQKFPLLEAARANALLETGRVTGNVVLVAPGLL